MNDEEVWRAVPGFEGRYEASTLGRVRSLDRAVPYAASHKSVAYSMLRRGVVLRAAAKPSGHMSVCLTRNVSSDVHAIVARTFIGPRPNGAEIRHLDGNEKNNRADNLAYGTKSQNGRDRKYHKGCSRYVLTPEQAAEIKRLARLIPKPTDKTLAGMFGVSPSTIFAIRHEVFHADVH